MHNLLSMWLVAPIAGCVWLLGAWLAAGLFYAYFATTYSIVWDHRWGYRRAWQFGLCFGPVGAMVAFLMGGFGKHGWRLR